MHLRAPGFQVFDKLVQVLVQVVHCLPLDVRRLLARPRPILERGLLLIPFDLVLAHGRLDELAMAQVARHAGGVVLEIGGGSIRIHNSELQSKIFDILGITKEDAERRFGHLLHAFEFGAPPHGGIAWGLDRLIMLFQDEENIREVMAFPKDQKAKDLMLNAPSEMPDAQVAEMHIRIDLPKK